VNFFKTSKKALESNDWKFFAFNALKNPALAKHFCKRYTEELRNAGFLKIPASTPLFATLPGIYYIYIQDVIRKNFIGGGRFHLYIPNIALPIQKVKAPYSKQLNDYIYFQSTRAFIGELSGFWVDRKYLKLHMVHLDLIQIAICLALGLALKLKCEKVICLSSRHMYRHAFSSGFRVKHEFGSDGKIPYPIGQYSYFMEWNANEAPMLVESDIMQLTCWSRNNIEHYFSSESPILI